MSDQPPTCVWVYHESPDFYMTSCENAYCFEHELGRDKSYTFCPGCGKRIALTPAVVEKEEDA